MVRRTGGGSSLLGARASFLVVENRHNACRAGFRVGLHAFKQTRQGCVSHLEVVDTTGGNQFVVNAEKGGRRCVEKCQVVVENFFRRYIEFFGHEPAYASLARLAVVENSGQREHVALARQWVAVVYRAVVVDGQMGDGQQRTVELHQPHLRLHRVVALEHHASGNRERTVEPGIENRTAVDLSVEAQHIAG